MILKKTDTIEVAAAKAGLSQATGHWLAAGSGLLPEKKSRGRRRPDPLADIFELDVVPIPEASPGIRPVGAFKELMRRHPELAWECREASGRSHGQSRVSQNRQQVLPLGLAMP